MKPREGRVTLVRAAVAPEAVRKPPARPDQATLRKRFNRIEGQVRGVAKMVEEQRQMMSQQRGSLLCDDDGPSICAEAAPDHYEALGRAVGADHLRLTERRLALVLLDRRWSDHLALIDDIREGIHLQRYGGRLPLTEFQRQIIDAYAAMMEGLREDVVETFTRLRAEGGTIDPERAGLRGPTSTWTYLVNDNPLPSFALQLIAVQLLQQS